MNNKLLKYLYDKYIDETEMNFSVFTNLLSQTEGLEEFYTSMLDYSDKLIYPNFESFKKLMYLGTEKVKQKTGNLFKDYPQSNNTQQTPVPTTGETQQSSTATTATTTTKPKFEWKTTLATPENVENGEIITLGMYGSIVKQIQQLLINNGYKEISTTGKPDGKFGNRTKNMVVKFQTDNKLSPDGKVGPKTWRVLVSGNIKPLETSQPKELPTDVPQQPMTTREIPQIQPENYMNNLKKLVKETLVETKENKKKTLQESKISNLRFKMIVESESKIDLDNALEEILLEMIYLHNQGFNNQIIAESVDGVFNVLSTLFKKSPDAIVNTFKEKGVNFIVSRLGMEKDTYLKNFLITVLGNTNMVDIPKLFTDCKFLTKKIAESIPEAYLRKLEYDKGMGNVFMDSVRNALHDVISNSDFAQRIENNIAGVVCPIVDKLAGKFEDSIGNMKTKLIGNTQV